LQGALRVRIVRFSTGSDPRFGIIGADADGTTTVAVSEGDPLYQGISLTGERIALDEVRLLAPVIPRSKVVCVGKNYPAHAQELAVNIGGDDGNTGQEPLIFLKPNTSVVGPSDAIIYPNSSREVHHESELAVVIGRLCKDVPPARASEVILGYTCANDVTARDLQRRDGQWTRAKSFDSFCPLGPWLVTDLDPSDLAIDCTVNGQLRQSARTSEMVHSVADIITFVSTVMSLLPGDVVLTGTPAGVGPLTVGDEVSVTIEGIGTLSNRVVRGE
jgi:2-keto-4-pentenoate hydratase/2-oxohepta-3-ene-1,7-dioic acid hydratase in catechol pathway